MKHGEGVYVFKDKGQFMEGVWVNGILKLSTIRYIDEPKSMRTQYVMPEVSIIEIVIVKKKIVYEVRAIYLKITVTNES